MCFSIFFLRELSFLDYSKWVLVFNRGWLNFNTKNTANGDDVRRGTGLFCHHPKSLYSDFFFAKSSFLRRQIRTEKLSPKVKNDSKVSTKEIQPKVVQETFLAKGNIFHGQFDSIKKFYSLVRQKKQDGFLVLLIPKKITYSWVAVRWTLLFRWFSQKSILVENRDFQEIRKSPS